MRMSRFHGPTLREAPKEARLPSHRLLLRAGYIRALGTGEKTGPILAANHYGWFERIARGLYDKAWPVTGPPS